MAWTDLSFAYGSLLTSTKMTQLDANLDALAEGASGAPKVEASAIKSNAVHDYHLAWENLVTAPFSVRNFDYTDATSEWIPPEGLYLFKTTPTWSSAARYHVFQFLNNSGTWDTHVCSSSWFMWVVQSGYFKINLFVPVNDGELTYKCLNPHV